MNAEIICVGTELVLGDILNTNAQYLSRKLAELGINVFFQTSVGDNPVRLRKVLAQAVDRSDVIVFTGGLGPTEDDLTKKTVCEAIGYSLKLHEPSAEAIRSYFARTGREMPESNLQQAMFPENAVIFPNSVGTAPGCALSEEGQHILFLPGPPRELEPMFEHYAMPYLARLGDGKIHSTVINVYGIGESSVAEQLTDLMQGQNPTVAPYAKTGEVQLRITAKEKTEEAAEALCKPIELEIKKRLGHSVYGVNKESLQQVVVELLREKGKKIATAESCTAGLLSKRLTDISGSSDVFEMGISAYSNDVKRELLEIDPYLLEDYGAVSPQVAAAMAQSVRRLASADLGVGITGLAGPQSDESGKPVGLVYIALFDGTDTYVIEAPKVGNVDRDLIRYIASSAALNLVRLYLTQPLPLSRGVLPNLIQGPVTEQSVKQPAADETVRAVAEEIRSTSMEAAEEHEMDEAEVNLFSASPQNEEQPLAEEEGIDLFRAKSNPELGEKQLGQPKKPSLFVRILRYFFPWKGDPLGEVIRKMALLIAIGGLIVGCAMLGQYYLDGLQAEGKLQNLVRLYHEQNAEDRYDSAVPNPKFNQLLAQNKDVIGWLTVPGTKTDNPVVQGPDDSYYLNHLFDRTQNRYGTIFLDSNASISYGAQSKNLVLYGHNMRDGTMMGQLTKYKDLEFYQANPVLTFDTLYRDGEWKIFAVFITNSRPSDDNGVVFHYRRKNFNSDEDFLGWIEQCKIRSIIDMPVDVQPDDEILTLSTCCYDFDEARFVVMARRVRYQENESSQVNVSAAKQNPNPVYPQAWYAKKGGTKPSLGTLNPDDYEPGSKINSYVDPSTATSTTLKKSPTQTTTNSNKVATGKPATTTNKKTNSTTSKQKSTTSKQHSSAQPTKAPPTTTLSNASGQTSTTKKQDSTKAPTQTSVAEQTEALTEPHGEPNSAVQESGGDNE